MFERAGIAVLLSILLIINKGKPSLENQYTSNQSNDILD